MTESKFSGALSRLRKPGERGRRPSPTLSPPVTPKAPSRAVGKSADPSWTKITILMRRTHKRNVRHRLDEEGEGRDLSTLIDELLTDWLAGNKT
jgi:hypothetical protein